MPTLQYAVTENIIVAQPLTESFYETQSTIGYTIAQTECHLNLLAVNYDCAVINMSEYLSQLQHLYQKCPFKNDLVFNVAVPEPHEKIEFLHALAQIFLLD